MLKDDDGPLEAQVDRIRQYVANPAVTEIHANCARRLLRYIAELHKRQTPKSKFAREAAIRQTVAEHIADVQCKAVEDMVRAAHKEKGDTDAPKKKQ